MVCSNQAKNLLSAMVDGAAVTRYFHSGQQLRRFGAIRPVFQGIDSEGAVMLSGEFVGELRKVWLPNVSDAGLDRIIDLLEKGSPLLVKGRFTGVMPTGCLATHVAWNHPRVSHRTQDAGIIWLTRIAGLNPATSHVIRAWDEYGPDNWSFRSDLVALLREERLARNADESSASEECGAEIDQADLVPI